MSGSLRVLPAETERLKHDQFDLLLESGLTLRLNDPRRFGSLHYTTEEPERAPLAARASRPSRSTPRSTPTICWRITRRRRAAIKQVLMNGRLVTGVGNIYASEALFRARINPRRSAAPPDARRLRAAGARRARRARRRDPRRRHDAARLRRHRRQSGTLSPEALCL